MKCHTLNFSEISYRPYFWVIRICQPLYPHFVQSWVLMFYQWHTRCHTSRVMDISYTRLLYIHYDILLQSLHTWTVLCAIIWAMCRITVTPTPRYVIDPDIYVYMLGTMSPYLGVNMKLWFYFRCINREFRSFRYLSTCFMYRWGVLGLVRYITHNYMIIWKT